MTVPLPATRRHYRDVGLKNIYDLDEGNSSIQTQLVAAFSCTAYSMKTIQEHDFRRLLYSDLRQEFLNDIVANKIGVKTVTRNLRIQGISFGCSPCVRLPPPRTRRVKRA